MKKFSLLLLYLLGSVACGSSDDASVNNNDPSVSGGGTNSTELSIKSDDFSVNGNLLGFITNNESSLPDVTVVSGRYRANLTDNSNDITLHYQNDQGRLDAKLLSFPFIFIARNIGIGTQLDSQIPHSSNGSSYIFAGVQIHVPDLESRNSSHIVVGHRGGTPFTIEGKNTLNGSSSVDDIGSNVVPLGRADIRVVGNSDRTITIYWQQPDQSEDNWVLYEGYKRGGGRLPGIAPTYGATVYVGLITYAQGSQDLPFVGTCDAIEIFE